MGTGNAVAVAEDIIRENSDYVVGFDLKPVFGDPADPKKVTSYTKEGAEPSFYSSDEAAKLKEAGKFEEAYAVTSSLPIAKTQAGMLSICPDETERCNNFNRGAKNKANNRLRAKLLDRDADGNFTFGPDDLTNGVYDLTAEIASPTKRIQLTEREKLVKFLETMPEAVRAAMLAEYDTSVQGKAA